MKNIIVSTQFKKDIKRSKKRGRDLKKLEKIIDSLVRDESLPARCRPHKLSGNYSDVWECHIEPDWLLIYDFDDIVLRLIRCGTHADLFE